MSRIKFTLVEACEFLLERCRCEGLDVVDGPHEEEFDATMEALRIAKGGSP